MCKIGWLLFALGAAFSTSSALRFGEYPFGVAEVLVVLGTILLSRVIWVDVVNGAFDKKVSALLVLIWASYAIGSLFGWGFLGGDAGKFRDCAALSYALVFAFVYHVLLRRGLAIGVWSERTLLLFVLLVTVAGGWLAYLGFDLFYSSSRLSGFAKNPNQFALLAAAGLALALRVESRRRADFVLKTISCLAFSFLGMMSGSDAFTVSLIAGVGAFFFFKYFKSGLILGFILAPVIFTAAIVLGQYIHQQVVEYVITMYEMGNQGQVRVDLWSNGIKAWVGSPLFGWGFGSHSGLVGPFEGSEAHNTFIDVAAASGMTGLLGLVSIIWMAFAKNRSLGVRVGIVILVVFSFFHYTIRHPLYWVVLIGALTIGEGARQRAMMGAPLNNRMLPDASCRGRRREG